MANPNEKRLPLSRINPSLSSPMPTQACHTLPHEVSAGNSQPALSSSQFTNKTSSSLPSLLPSTQLQPAPSSSVPSQRFPYPINFPSQTPMVLVPASNLVQQRGDAAAVNTIQEGVQQSSSGKKKKEANNARRKLSHNENLVIIDYWKVHYEDFMRSNKKEFASRAVEKLNRDPSFIDPRKPPLAASQLDGVLKYWMKRYKEVSDQFKNSGFGLTEDDPDSLKAVGTKKFKYFWELHEFLSCCANVSPPVLLQPRRSNDHDVVDISTFGVSGGGAELSDHETERDDEHLIDMVDVEAQGDELSKGEKRRCSGSKRLSRGSSNTVQEPAKQPGDIVAKKRRLSTGALLLQDSQNIKEKEPSQGRSNGLSEKEGKNSTGRIKIVNEMLASQITSTEEQNDSYARTVAAIEKETEIRSKEVSIMEKDAFIRIRESEILEREQARKDREEERMKKEEERRDKDERRKEEEAMRNGIMAKRKMIMDEAEQLRKQADMYMKLGLKQEAVGAMKESEALIKKLSDTVEDKA